MPYYYPSTATGAPQLQPTAGALRTILKTCLQDGWGAGSVAALSVTDGVATASYSTPHPFKPGMTVRLQGASVPSLNADHVVLSTPSGTTLTFATSAPNGAVTGTVTSRVPGAGWEETFADGHVGVYKPATVEALGLSLRVDDTGAATARVRGYESMTDAATGVGPIPTEVQQAGGAYWQKAYGGVPRPWMVVADGRAVYFVVDANGNGRYQIFFAGDLDPLASVDAWAWAVTGNASDTEGAGTSPPGACMGYSTRYARAGAWLARGRSGMAGAVVAQRTGARQNGTLDAVYSGRSGYSATGLYPSVDGELLLSRLELVTQSGLRGHAPGFLHCSQDLGDAFQTGDLIDGTNALAGRKLMALRVGEPNQSAVRGTVFFDLTGPWR